MVVSVNRREQSARVQLRDGNTITISWDEAVEKPQAADVDAVEQAAVVVAAEIIPAE